MGEEHAIYEFTKLEPGRLKGAKRRQALKLRLTGGSEEEVNYHLIAALGTITAAVGRLRAGHLPIEPDPELGHAANLLYMFTGRRPTPAEVRIMDISLILHADHGMNASTFASMVVASTLSDVYQSIESGIAALNGPLHGGANEQVLLTLREIGEPKNVKKWYAEAREKKRKIMGFGHRVYKSYDPRARVLRPLAHYMSQSDKKAHHLLTIAEGLEKEVVASLGKQKGIYPNVDFYSGITYSCLGIPVAMFTPVFAVSRVSGWCARVKEYLKNNRIFRPRAMYTGAFDREYKEIGKRRAPAAPELPATP
jgi:citrate synthase